MRRTLPVLLLAIFCLLLAGSAHALTYVRMEDGQLADSAAIIAEVEVIDQGVSRIAGRPHTDYQVAVHRLIKGYLPGSTVVVRVLGGQMQDGGLSLKVFGVPRFAAGRRAIVFLEPRTDGTFGVAQLSLGAFHVVERGQQRLVVRDLSEAEAVSAGGEVVAASEPLRDAGLFSEWLAARAAGLERAADYVLPASSSDLQAIADAFTLFRDSDTGLNLRWPVFDSGGSVTFFAHEDGQPGLSGGGFSQFQNALALWVNDRATNVDYRYGGTTDKDGGLEDPCDFGPTCTVNGPFVNAILFNNPNNDPLFPGTFSCSNGGVLAIAATWYSDQVRHNYNGQQFINILSADIVTNRNVGCFLSVNQGAAEVFSHEVGHTLGLGHSCDDPSSGVCDTEAKAEALMRAIAHGDGRGGRLGIDDRNGVAFLYTPIVGGNCVENATTLCLSNNRFRVNTSWLRTNGQTGQGQAVELTGDTGYFWFFNAANVEMVLKVLNACGAPTPRYWVFAGGLTNVDVVTTVTDTQAGRVKTYINPQSTAFQTVQDTSAFATCP